MAQGMFCKEWRERIGRALARSHDRTMPQCALKRGGRSFRRQDQMEMSKEKRRVTKIVRNLILRVSPEPR
jgi:hypothetical protein